MEEWPGRPIRFIRPVDWTTQSLYTILKNCLHLDEFTMARKKIQAVAYLRTSSAANVGADKDSDKRQRAAIAAYAKAAGVEIVEEYYDEAVSGADHDRHPAGLQGHAGAAAVERRAHHRGRDRQPLRPRPDGAGDRLRDAEGARHRL